MNGSNKMMLGPSYRFSTQISFAICVVGSVHLRIYVFKNSFRGSGRYRTLRDYNRLFSLSVLYHRPCPFPTFRYVLMVCGHSCQRKLQTSLFLHVISRIRKASRGGFLTLLRVTSVLKIQGALSSHPPVSSLSS